MLPWLTLKYLIAAVAAALSAILAVHCDSTSIVLSSKLIQTRLFGWDELLAGAGRAMGGVMFSDANGEFMDYIVGIEGIPIRMSDWTDGGVGGELGGDEWAAEPTSFDFDFGESFADATDAPDPSFVFFSTDDAHFVEDDTAPVYEEQWEEGENGGEGLPVVRIIAIAALVYHGLYVSISSSIPCPAKR